MNPSKVDMEFVVLRLPKPADGLPTMGGAPRLFWRGEPLDIPLAPDYEISVREDGCATLRLNVPVTIETEDK